MKIIKYILPVVLLGLSVSCSDGDRLVDEVLAETTSGGILRTVSTNSATLDYDDPAQAWSIIVEAQDSQDGDLLESVDVYAGLYRETALVGDEELIKEVPASAFSMGEFGYPRGEISVSLEELTSTLGLSDEEYLLTDEFRIRLVYVMTNGQTWTNTDAGGTVLTSSFFRSPYFYTVTFAD